MLKKISPLLPLLLFITLSVSFASAAFGGAIGYSLADLEGTWEGNGLASGPGAPWWERSTITIASDGTFSGTAVESTGNNNPVSGKFTISTDGIIRLEGIADNLFLCTMDSGKTVFACTATWTTGSPGTSEMKIFTKQAISYSSPDLTGKWKFNALASGAGAPFWARVNLTVRADNSCSGTAAFNDGSSHSFSGTCSISADGIVTLPNGDPHRCVMDAGKSVIVCTSTWLTGNPGTTEMTIGTKKTTAYAQADLTGIWNFNALASGPGAPFWDRISLAVYANGTCSGTETDNAGSSSPVSGTCSISSGGIVTFSFANKSARCVMDAGKSGIACTSTWPKGSPGTTDMGIGVKAGPWLILTSPNGGEVLPSGSPHKITWAADASVTKFTLKYSMDNGATWQKIASFVPGSDYNWLVPVPAGNRNKCLVQVIGYDSSNVKIAADISDKPFAIEVVRLTSPNGGEYLPSGSLHTIIWTTNATQKPVARAELLYTRDNGASWSVIKTIAGNPGSYGWTVPCIAQTTSGGKVKVILTDSLGNALGNDASDNTLTLAHACADISGGWTVNESGNISCHFSDGSSDSGSIGGSGSAFITQNNCAVSWLVPGTTVSRSGSVCGNTVKFSGILCLPAVTGISFTENNYAGKGTISDGSIAGKGSGQCAGSYQGMTFTCTASSSFAFTKNLYASPDEGIAPGESGKMLMHDLLKAYPAACP